MSSLGFRAALVALAAVLTVSADAQTLVLDGKVEPSERAVLSSRLNGVVAETLFRGGEHVVAGQPLIRLDAADAQLAVAVADAEVAAARAQLDGATRNARRQEELFERGISADAVVGPARTALAAAEAGLALAQARHEIALLDLERTVIRAPIEGFVSRTDVAVGAFLEAEAGPPLASIAALDPVIVAYATPYADRLTVLEESGAASVEELFERISLSLLLPRDGLYPHKAVPLAASAEVDEASGAVTVWARFPNPDALIRPGMRVTVLSNIAAAPSP